MLSEEISAQFLHAVPSEVSSSLPVASSAKIDFWGQDHTDAAMSHPLWWPCGGELGLQQSCWGSPGRCQHGFVSGQLTRSLAQTCRISFWLSVLFWECGALCPARIQCFPRSGKWTPFCLCRAQLAHDWQFSLWLQFWAFHCGLGQSQVPIRRLLWTALPTCTLEFCPSLLHQRHFRATSKSGLGCVPLPQETWSQSSGLPVPLALSTNPTRLVLLAVTQQKNAGEKLVCVHLKISHRT